MAECLACDNPKYGMTESIIDLPEDKCPRGKEPNSIFYGKRYITVVLPVLLALSRLPFARRIPLSMIHGHSETDTAGKGKVFGCPVNTAVTLGDLSLVDFPVLGVTRVDEQQASLGRSYS
jgi:hypothetical protein